MLYKKAYDYVLSAVFFSNVEKIADLHNDKCLTLVQWLVQCLGPLLPKAANTPVGVKYDRFLCGNEEVITASGSLVVFF